MGAGLSLTLETAKYTLLNTQTQIQAASNNVSNAGNKTYAKQKVILQSNPAYRTAGGWIGTGARVSQVAQLRDLYIEQRLRNSITDENQYGSLATHLGSIQDAFADDGATGISEMLGKFWDSWDQLGQAPDVVASQTGVYDSAANLADSIKAAYNRLNEIAGQLPVEIDDTVAQANAIINNIADMNIKIIQAEGGTGYQANDLRDERYAALQDLAKLIPVTYSEDASGAVTVTTTDSSGPVTIVSAGTATPITNAMTITGGQLGGLKNAIADLTGYMDQLDDFAGTLIAQVNSLHGQNSGPAVFTGSGAADITASTTFLDGQTSADEMARAQKLAALQDEKVTFTDGSSATFSGYLGNIEKQIGLDVDQAETGKSYNEALHASLDIQQQSVSGVSIDEETVDLLQFQRVYQAAAKIVDMTSQMLNAIIAMVK